ncbi:MAG TPA: succinate dehydrogenase, hydrophobic membrane anchor protein [Kiloniellaceae bacterium]|nr:succinate dehydrogenase, hydrophobic membrane anchor protein [Kiloniellaceae bacterium]
MSLQSHLARVRGLGSAKAGTAHWWSQRLTAIALVPLLVWFVASLIGMAGADYYTMRAWVGSPVVAGLLILLIVATFYHAYLGLQVIIEDYVHREACKIGSLLLVKAACLVLAMTGVLSVLSILFKG